MKAETGRDGTAALGSDHRVARLFGAIFGGLLCKYIVVVWDSDVPGRLTFSFTSASS
jgi:hypothetical protein